ncbi:hypothetical protein HIM_08748 [Hirsutella minnesotensis 3608]|uniref:Ubiquitin interaction domain-containing protein n=1 Tax=Hirsutella minnesotensis 3608 TaxID=1043627 RepID=A0A0F7ZST1_9HYPO|nr:hypothetical protein HIM_08748 [Hirsutella minnesotensis 3608]
MASKEPTDDEISRVIDFAGLDPVEDRFMVVQALKDNDRNVETVVMQYYDNPTSFRQKFARLWDESLFSADRDGNDNHTGISFHIESMGQNEVIQGVTPPPDGYGPGAPSRPPSRSNDRSPLGRMVDWTAGGDMSGSLNTQSKEDEDMQRALRESAQEAGITVPQQESGVLESTQSASHFGPANRQEYDQNSWAMVPSASASALADPLPEMRKRIDGAPAFLVSGNGSAGEHTLGGLLTILHAIPLSRNILLQTGSPADSYGFNSEWWKGQEILPPQVLAKIQSGELQWNDRHGPLPNSDHEIHRLMAFLDATERGYGTVSVLSDLFPFPNVPPEKKLFEYLMQQNQELTMPLTQIATLSPVKDDEIGQEDARFGLLEIEHLRADYSNIKTLYESFDHIMWTDALSWGEIHESAKMAMFKDMGEVLTIKIGGDGPEDSIEIPEELFPEKYLISRKAEARRIQQGWCDTKKAMQLISQDEQELYEWRNDWDHQSFDKKEMLSRVIGQWTAYRDYLETRGRFRGMEQSGFNTDKYPDYRAAPCQMDEEGQHLHQGAEGVLRLAEHALADIDERLKALNRDLEQIRARQRFLGKLLTAPEKPGRPKPMTCKRYLLCGVATPKDVVYVRRHSEPNLIDLEGESQTRDQWWKLAYAPKSEHPVMAEQTEIEQVLREVWQETKNPLFVYATEDALQTSRIPLSPPLERFTRAENKAFRQELSRQSGDATDARRVSMMDAISPSKRKHRADSADSMDTNRASLGSDDRNGFDNPFEDREVVTVTELADLSEPSHATDAETGGARTTSLDGDEPRPPLPSRPPLHGDTTSDWVAQSGIAEGRRNLTAVEQCNTPTSLADEEDGQASRVPEMQERARPPSFIAAAQAKTFQSKQASGIDMDLPDYQE